MVQVLPLIWRDILPNEGAVGKFRSLLWFLLYPRVSLACCLGSNIQDFVWIFIVAHVSQCVAFTADFEQNKTIQVCGCSFKEKSKMYTLSC